MIIDRVVLHNVGLFAGTNHRLDLTPPSPNKPVVVVGGLNGAGKTTLLEAMQLALYGRHAPIGRRDGLSYEEYLRRLINQSAHPANEGAAVELFLRLADQEQEKRLRLRRSWRAGESRVYESVEVFDLGKHDDVGQLDASISEAWGEKISQIIPPQLANLFFFDGERIEALADPERSSDVLLTAINALLGIDLVEQAQTDLQALERRRSSTDCTDPERERLEEADRQLDEARSKLADAVQQAGQLRAQCDQAAAKLEDVEKNFIRQGGALAENRKDVEAKREQLLRQISELENNLCEVAATDLPLILVRKLLRDVVKQANDAEASERYSIVKETVVARDARILARLRKSKISQDVLDRVQLAFDAERLESLAEPKVGNVRLNPAARVRTEGLLSRELERQRELASKLVTQQEELESALESLDRRLAAVPDEAAIAAVVSERNNARERLQELQIRLKLAEEQQKLLGTEIETLSENRSRLARESEVGKLDNSDRTRFLRHASSARQVLAAFRVAVTKRHARRLETLILEGYKQLLRKKGLVQEIRIDPVTCRLRLIGRENTEIPPERLSAGERQLLAVAILWGLARACSRQLPVVVDTPLGRLDTTHRTHLVERYFPNASHQVLLLSTDEEIDERYLRILKKHIGHCYRLVHDEQTGGTRIEKGYFWEGITLC